MQMRVAGGPVADPGHDDGDPVGKPAQLVGDLTIQAACVDRPLARPARVDLVVDHGSDVAGRGGYIPYEGREVDLTVGSGKQWDGGCPQRVGTQAGGVQSI